MDCSLPASSIHGIFQARVLEWGAIAFTEKEALSPTNLPRNSCSWTEIESSQFLSVFMLIYLKKKKHTFKNMWFLNFNKV